MGRAGGWILGLIVVLGMAATALVAFRPILFRKTVTIEFHDAGDRTDQETSAIRLAFTDRNLRAAHYRIEPAFLSGQFVFSPKRLRVSRDSTQAWGVVRPDSEKERLQLNPRPAILGVQAARWAQRSGITRVFIPGVENGGAFEAGFVGTATASGIRCGSTFLHPQGRSLVDAILQFKTELVVLDLAYSATLIDALRSSGYAGRSLIFMPKGATPSSSVLEGALLASSFGPTPAEFATRASSNDYTAYRIATLVLDAIEQAGTDDPSEIYRRLTPSEESSVLPGALYVVRNGKVEFVEPLK